MDIHVRETSTSLENSNASISPISTAPAVVVVVSATSIVTITISIHCSCPIVVKKKSRNVGHVVGRWKNKPPCLKNWSEFVFISICVSHRVTGRAFFEKKSFQAYTGSDQTRYTAADALAKKENDFPPPPIWWWQSQVVPSEYSKKWVLENLVLIRIVQKKTIHPGRPTVKYICLCGFPPFGQAVPLFLERCAVHPTNTKKKSESMANVRFWIRGWMTGTVSWVEVDIDCRPKDPCLRSQIDCLCYESYQ